MRTFLKNSKNDQRGFTLIELMVVVLIIGILLAVAVPVYNSAQAKAKQTACKANIRMIKSAIVQAELDGVKFQEGESDLNSLEEVFKDYFEDLPVCPGDGEYKIKIDDEGKHSVACTKHSTSKDLDDESRSETE